MSSNSPWPTFIGGLEAAVASVVDDADPLNERELADGHQYVLRILRTVADTSLVEIDFERPSFLTMLESVRHLGAAGPDIDYDVAILVPGEHYRISGTRGDACYVGIVVYGSAGSEGASAILASVDVDTLADEAGEFVYDIQHADAARVIVRQYFHDRSTEGAGTWQIERVGRRADAHAAQPPRPVLGVVGHQIVNGAETMRWNAELNRLWTPERRAFPNEFVRLTADDIVAAVPNPDVVYAFTWWRIAESEALVIDADPPDTRYWAIQLCDRWFQSYPQRRTNLNDRQVVYRDDGTIRCVVADRDPGVGNWLDSGGHRTGVVFFRWLHADPDTLPNCRVVPLTEVS